MEKKQKEKKNGGTVLKPILVMVSCFAFTMVLLCLFIIWVLPGTRKSLSVDTEYQIRSFVENLDAVSDISGKTVVAKRKGESERYYYVDDNCIKTMPFDLSLPAKLTTYKTNTSIDLFMLISSLHCIFYEEDCFERMECQWVSLSKKPDE